MKSLGDYLHSKGLKFGVYSSAGTKTCQGRAGSLGYEQIDAQDYASWGVDYLKYDNCFNQNLPSLTRYPAMRDALNATGRPIFYSLCQWGEEKTTHWAPQVANSWRTTQDIANFWNSLEYNFRLNLVGREAAGPGGWNDPDMLEVGNGGLTLEEEKTHFSLWAISKAPLIIGCDLSKVSAESLAILMNEEVIAINQDPGSEQAQCQQGCGWWNSIIRRPSIYSSRMSNGDVVAAIVNWRGTHYSDFKFKLSLIGIVPLPGYKVQVRDLNLHQNIATFEDKYDAASVHITNLPAHGHKLYRFKVFRDNDENTLI